MIYTGTPEDVKKLFAGREEDIKKAALQAREANLTLQSICFDSLEDESSIEVVQRNLGREYLSLLLNNNYI